MVSINRSINHGIHILWQAFGLWDFGLWDFGTGGLLDFGTLDFGTLGLVDFWTLGLWTLVLWDWWTLGLLDFGISGLAFIDNSESQRQFFDNWEHCFTLHPLHRFFDNLECPGNFVTTQNAKTFSTTKKAEGNFSTTKNAKRNFLTIEGAKAIFGISRFRPRNQALKARKTQSEGPRNPRELVPQGTQGRKIPERTAHYCGTQQEPL